MNSDRYFCLPFFDVFCAEVHPVRRQKLRHVCNVGTTNDVNENPISKGRTPLIRAPIGFYAKVRLFKARFEGEAAIF